MQNDLKKRIALYWHNGRSLGHTVRSAVLGQALLEHMPDSAVVGITGASKGFELLPPGMDLVKIPSYLAFDNEQGARSSPILPVAKDNFQRIRENLIATFIRDFQPHAFIVDYHPEGKNGELIPAVMHSPGTKKVLGLRGILGTPVETNSQFFNPRLAAFMRDHFSAIHVYVDERVFRLEEYYQVPGPLLEMVKYTGYVTRLHVGTKEQARAQLQLDRDARIVVVSFGGGQGTEPIWHAIMNGLARINKLFDGAYFAAGPYLEAGAFQRLQMRVAEHANWHWTRLLDPLPAWMKASDFFIGSGGYNSLTEVIATGANALIIPRQLNEREQVLHTTRLADLLLLRKVSLETVLYEDITELLVACLHELYPMHGQVRIATDGARENARLVQALISEQ